MSAHAPPTAIGGRILTKPFLVMVGLAAGAAGILAYRFVFGLGAVTNLSDGYPWGLWITFDVVVGTALATGGYAIAILVFLLNQGRYHPLVRPALVTSALGYSMGGLGVVIDVGRWWNVAKVPFAFWTWNLNSILLEVALCIMLYTLVLWIEVSPFLLQRFAGRGQGRLERFASWSVPRLKRVMPLLVALGLLLPTMHQSSLGSLMLLAGSKLHPLWQTPILPLLFLVSCIGMGYGVVVLEGMTTRTAFGRLRETPVQAGLTKAAMVTMLLWMILRLGDVIARGQLPTAVAPTAMATLFWAEFWLFVAAFAFLARQAKKYNRGHLFRSAGLMVLAGTLYRFSTFLLAFDPGPGWSYFPAIPEVLVTIGIVAGEIALYVVIVKRFPIVGGARPAVRPAALPEQTQPVAGRP